MAWEIVSKEEVAELAGVSQSDLRDFWYDFAVDYIEQEVNQYNIADPTAIVETLDGNGTSSIRVKRPPIQSVTYVKIEDVTIASTMYGFDENFIQLDSPLVNDVVQRNPYQVYDKFPIGRNNVEVSYTSGTSTVESQVWPFAIATIVREISAVSSSEGSMVRLQFSSPDRSVGDARYIRGRLDSKIRSIVLNLFRVKFRAH